MTTSLERPAAGATPPAAGRPLVVLEQINKSFGPIQVLFDIDLTVHAGEVVVVIGPSGSAMP
jgi:glutamate transport system ATP-binding protein